MRLDLEPDLEARLRLPDGGHFRAGITGNHLGSPDERAAVSGTPPGTIPGPTPSQMPLRGALAEWPG
jgi:hypothetical protein